MSTSFSFYQGQNDLIEKIPEEEKKIEYLKERFSEFFNVKNIHFLFGSGTSSGAIPTMTELFEKTKIEVEQTSEDLKTKFNRFKEYNKRKNIEEILGALYAYRSYSNSAELKISFIKELIDLIESIIFNEINISFLEPKHKEILEYYMIFYQKVALRSRDLARVNVFTTNNDLMNERALDRLNINYINGFGGGIDKYFNPALFNYTFSKRMDTSIDKFEPVENMVYLYKLHGSVNWVEDEADKNYFFNIKELNNAKKSDYNILIYPNPLKQNKSLGSPYSDLFREFQRKLLEPHSVLFIIGYGFNDEHVNNVIFQALATNSAINVVVLNKVNNKVIANNNDNRIFRIFGEIEGNKIHHFEYFVKKLLPDLNSNKSNSIIEDFIDTLKRVK